MFRSRERGMSFWPFAVSLLAVIVLLVMWFGVSSERDQAKASAASAENNRKIAEEEKNAALTRLGNLSRPTGYTGGGNFSDPALIDAAVKEFAQKLRETMVMEFPADRYQQVEGGGVVEKGAGDTVKVYYLTDAELADANTLQSFFSKFEVAAKRMRLDIERSLAAGQLSVSEKEAVVKTYEATIADKDRRIAELTGEKGATENQMREKETELKDQIAQLTSQKDAKESELEALRKQADENVKKLTQQLNDKEGQVRSLVQREAPTLTEGPDGEVLMADAGVAIINRGRSQWLMPGTIFDVWGLAKGGVKYRKGSIKVTSVDEETARGAILDETARDPITRGDLVQSLTYSPNRKLHFVLIGDFKKMGRSQAEAVLTRLGAQVDARVTAETNYLVVGLPAAGQESMEDSPEVKAAKDLGIRMITEEQLGSFTRY